MANYRLFLDKPCEGVLGKSTKYHYEDEMLTIEWCGERGNHYFPEKSAVIVRCNGGMPDALKLHWPRNFRWRALWLCGVPKQMRFDSNEKFEAAADAAGAVKVYFGRGWKIAMVEGEDGKEKPAAGWMADRVDDREIRRMVKACAPDVPAWFVRKVMGIVV